eukprot:GEMP01017818.1.p1 GENE.GEMP01017818.1~~GEMP01017818.1.p1  ORF type:complete len:356 (+),score=45.54 GEMP01017818.1:170-1237(+)
MSPRVKVGPFQKYKSLVSLAQSNYNRHHFGNAARFLSGLTDKAIPGPGKYNVKIQLARPWSAPSYGIGRRLEIPRPSSAGRQCPGPGEYKLKDTLNKTGTSLEGKTIRGSAPPKSFWDIRPDMGAYNPKLPQSQRTCSFGARVRPSSAPPQYSAAPMGPHSTLGKGGTRFGPPPSTRPSSAQATRSTHRSPGQGEYVLPSSFRYDIGHQFGRKLEWPQRASSVPGPGAYNDRKTLGANRSPKYSIAFKRKDRTKRFQGPAPYILPSAVRYDVGRQFGRIVQMPNHASSAPGPGTYAIPQGLGVDRSPKYSMYFRRDDIRKLRGPDPYLLPSTLTGPRFSFGRGLHCVNVTRTRTR